MDYRDPHQNVLRAVLNLYGPLSVRIRFDPSFRKRLFWGHWGYTDFSKEIPEIRISAYVPVFHSLEILAHELAHVIAGLKEGHGEKWEVCFRRIHEEHLRLLEIQMDGDNGLYV